MKKDKEFTEVLFRKDKHGEHKGTITAVFPYQPEYNGTVTCYAHVGQHGTASIEWMRETTTYATPSEYTALKRELEGLGYRLRIIQRMNMNRYNEARVKLIQRMKQ